VREVEKRASGMRKTNGHAKDSAKQRNQNIFKMDAPPVACRKISATTPG
jgi:hypothetical protein